MDKKRCNKCLLWLPFDAFRKCNRNKYGLYRLCKKCHAAEQRVYDARDRLRLYRRCKRHGITVSEYWRMHRKQGGLCGGCKRSEKELGKEFRIDHDHETGEFRGLLCDACNTSLGQLKENVSYISGLLAYAIDIKTRVPALRVTQLRLIG